MTDTIIDRSKKGRGAALPGWISLPDMDAGSLVVLKEAGTKEDGEVSLPDNTPTCCVACLIAGLSEAMTRPESRIIHAVVTIRKDMFGRGCLHFSMVIDVCSTYIKGTAKKSLLIVNPDFHRIMPCFGMRNLRARGN